MASDRNYSDRYGHSQQAGYYDGYAHDQQGSMQSTQSGNFYRGRHPSGGYGSNQSYPSRQSGSDQSQSSYYHQSRRFDRHGYDQDEPSSDNHIDHPDSPDNPEIDLPPEKEPFGYTSSSPNGNDCREPIGYQVHDIPTAQHLELVPGGIARSHHSGIPPHSQRQSYESSGLDLQSNQDSHRPPRGRNHQKDEMHPITEDNLDRVHGPRDSLDPSFKVQGNPRRFFKAGRVFALLWHQNRGQNNNTAGSNTAPSNFTSYGLYGQPIYSCIRRMVVFKERNGSALCFTYSRQGVGKHGVDPSKHSIIHMEGVSPERGPNEPLMTKDPIAVVPTKADCKLDKMSRIDFEKIHNVEHNQRVMPIGKISEGSMPKFIGYAKSELAK
ncbi:hypothetical protein ASPZODRAFT_142023 [Penicilliopsis zonata CBS 506.65]|uniref:DUF6590 domain-containing protein n=1 Tax=Penicilliopsis zonata CBS 506.65 TaxID=1073090 RepID=A0A1L9SJ74_9EURO|nr:hypothetical protein ASPZODRAFT_142023 [Penicilliopsis zonata CBS 506.65]OJJ47279.1 hypothetical protein ASPZODRAFT_142023 [Penicilliopsis zonata CBS 506.65]